MSKVTFSSSSDENALRKHIMRVCMVVYSYYEFDLRVRRYAEALVQRGAEVDVIALRSEDQSSYELFEGVHLHRIQQRIVNEKSKLSYLIKLLSFFVRSFWFLTRAQWSRKYDLIHVHSVPDFEVFAALVPKLLGARIILDIHDLVPEFYSSKFGSSGGSFVFRVLLLVEKLSIWFSDYVIAANHLWQAKLEARSTSPKKCMTLLNFPNRSIFACQEGYRRGDRMVLIYPGTLNYHQGLDIAIRAIALIKHEAPEVELHIYGRGDQKDSLAKLVAELGLSDRIYIRGLVPVRELARLMNEADVGIVPKRAASFGNEAFSTKILEFMSVGLPVVASATMIDRYYFNDDVVAFFESDNARDLADCILRLRKHPQVRQRLAENALRLVARYDWEVHKEDYFALVDKLTCKPSNLKAGRGNLTVGYKGEVSECASKQAERS